MPLDIIDSKILKPTPLLEEETPPRNFCKIFFDNKNNGKINLSRIFHDPLIKAVLSNTSAHFHTPTLVCTLENAIGSQILTLINL